MKKKTTAKKTITVRSIHEGKKILDFSGMRTYIVKFRNKETGNEFECLQRANSIAEIRKGWAQLEGKTGKYQFLSVRSKAIQSK